MMNMHELGSSAKGAVDAVSKAVTDPQHGSVWVRALNLLGALAAIIMLLTAIGGIFLRGYQWVTEIEGALFDLKVSTTRVTDNVDKQGAEYGEILRRLSETERLIEHLLAPQKDVVKFYMDESSIETGAPGETVEITWTVERLEPCLIDDVQLHIVDRTGKSGIAQMTIEPIQVPVGGKRILNYDVVLPKDIEPGLASVQALLIYECGTGNGRHVVEYSDEINFIVEEPEQPDPQPEVPTQEMGIREERETDPVPHPEPVPGTK